LFAACQYLYPRFTIEELQEVLTSQQEYVLKLETEVKKLKAIVEN